MANTADDTLLEEFAAIAGQMATGGSAGLIAEMTGATGAIANTPEAQTTGGTSANSGGSSGGGTSALSIATTVLTSGLGLVPLIGGLIGLFDGGGGSTEEPLTKYAMPDPVRFQGVETDAGIQFGSTNQVGMPRAAGGGVDSGGATAGAVTGGNGTPQITVNVQAMDARSFMDRSSDIAAAVREAMLNLNAINDVVTNL